MGDMNRSPPSSRDDLRVPAGRVLGLRRAASVPEGYTAFGEGDGKRPLPLASDRSRRLMAASLEVLGWQVDGKNGHTGLTGSVRGPVDSRHLICREVCGNDTGRGEGSGETAGVVMLTGLASPLGALTGRAHCSPIGRHYRGVETLRRHYWTPHCLEVVLHFHEFVGMNRVL